MLLLTRI